MTAAVKVLVTLPIGTWASSGRSCPVARSDFPYAPFQMPLPGTETHTAMPGMSYFSMVTATTRSNRAAVGAGNEFCTEEDASVEEVVPVFASADW